MKGTRYPDEFKGEAPFERRSDLIDPTDSIDKATPQ